MWCIVPLFSFYPFKSLQPLIIYLFQQELVSRVKMLTVFQPCNAPPYFSSEIANVMAYSNLKALMTKT